MHIYSIEVASFLEKLIKTIHIATSHYENILLHVFALERNERVPLNLGFKLTILIFKSLGSLQFVGFFPIQFAILSTDMDYCILTFIKKHNLQEKVVKFVVYLFQVLSFVPLTCAMKLRQF